MNNHYSMLIEWSAEDDAYVVSFPEFLGAHTHGATYGEAVQNAQEVLTLLVETFEQEGKPLPQPARQRPALTQVYL